MKTSLYSRLMLGSASSVMMLSLATPALATSDAAAPAADATPASSTPAAEEIVVTGIRGSLQRDLDIKRRAPGVVDAISAEDIGKFPDPNVAASLQRLPGVTVQISGNRGEATGVTVRGFSGDFNETLYDGRHISTATGGRAIDFSTVGSDFIGQLAVYKTPDVTLSASAIGATINIAFPKPLDHPGFHMAAAMSGTIQDRAGRVEPTGGLLVSDTFADDTMGILGDVAYTRHDTTTNHVFVNGWEGGHYKPCQLAGSPTACGQGTVASNTASVLGWFPQQAGAEQNTARDQRIDARLAYQWRPNDQLLLTVDDNFSSQLVQTNSYGYAAWFNMGSLTNVKLDGNGTTVDFNQPGTPMDMNAGITHSLTDTNQFGVNLKYDPSEHLHFDFDAATAKSWLNPNGEIGTNDSDIGYGGTLGANTGLAVNGASSSNLPVLHDIGPSGNASEFLDQALIGSHVMVRQAQRNTDRVRQFHLKGTWEADNVKLQFGGSYMEDQFHLQESDTFTNNFWQAYAGYGAASGRTTGVSLPASIYGSTISTANFIPGYSGNLAPGILQYNPLAVYNYLQGLGNPYAKNIPGFNYCDPTTTTGGLCNYTGTLALAQSPSSVATIRERTWSAYVRGNFETNIAGKPFHFDSGIRVEHTGLTTQALGQTPTALTTSTADPTLLTTVYANNGATTAINSGHDYTYLLPSMDLMFEATNKLHVRLDASRTLTRPALSVLNPVLNVGSGQRVGALTASGGNPDLQPYLSDNFDVAGEWYYQSNSYFSVDLFLKHVSNFIIAGVQRQSINGVIDPTTGQLAQFSVSQQVNGPDATIRGAEIALQHVFGRSGFGFTANATFVGSNKPYDPTNLTTTGFAVTGIGNSANFVGFYDKHGLQARVAVNWRGSYLLQFGQNQNTGAFGAEPTFVNSQLQVDLSGSYDLNRHATLFGGITNLNDSVYSTHGRFSNQLLDAYAYGRRFTFGARYHF